MIAAVLVIAVALLIVTGGGSPNPFASMFLILSVTFPAMVLFAQYFAFWPMKRGARE